jgi:hypothetical protein
VASLLKQTRLLVAVPEEVRWTADLDAGTFQLGELTVPADVIGTESSAAQTFLWGWANPSTPTCATAEVMRRLGEERGIADLTDDAELAVDTMNAGVASLIASGVADLDCYYLATHDERTVAFAIRDEGLGRVAPALIHFSSAFLEVASVVPFGHRRALAHYLAHPLPQLPAAVEGGRAVLRAEDTVMSLRFDHQGRMADIRVEASPG